MWQGLDKRREPADIGRKRREEEGKREGEERERRNEKEKSCDEVTARCVHEICLYFDVHTCMYIAAQKSRGGKRSVYTAANTERSRSRSSFDVDHELATDSPGEQDSVGLAGKQVWHSMAPSAQATLVCWW